MLRASPRSRARANPSSKRARAGPVVALGPGEVARRVERPHPPGRRGGAGRAEQLLEPPASFGELPAHGPEPRQGAREAQPGCPPLRARWPTGGPGAGCRAPPGAGPATPRARARPASAPPAPPAPGSTRRAAAGRPRPSRCPAVARRAYSRTVSSSAKRGSPSACSSCRSRLLSASAARPSSTPASGPTRGARGRHTASAAVQRAAAHEHREPGEERPLGGRQQAVAPVEGGPQRPLAGRRVPSAPGEHGQAAAQARRSSAPGGSSLTRAVGQLDGQREPVDAGADGGDGGGVLLRDGEVGPDGPRPLDEEGDRLAAGERLRRGRALGVGERQRGHRVLALGGQAERGAAGGEHPQARRGRQQVGHDRRGVRHLLEVVQDQQQALGLEVARERLAQGFAGDLPDTERPGDGTEHQLRVAERGQRDEPHPVRERRAGRRAVAAASSSAATCRARRVLPTPPGPVSVSSRPSACSRRRRTASMALSRPMKGVGWAGRLCGRRSRLRSGGKSGGSSRMRAAGRRARAAPGPSGGARPDRAGAPPGARPAPARPWRRRAPPAPRARWPSAARSGTAAPRSSGPPGRSTSPVCSPIRA